MHCCDCCQTRRQSLLATRTPVDQIEFGSQSAAIEQARVGIELCNQRIAEALGNPNKEMQPPTSLLAASRARPRGARSGAAFLCSGSPELLQCVGCTVRCLRELVQLLHSESQTLFGPQACALQAAIGDVFGSSRSSAKQTCSPLIANQCAWQHKSRPQN